MLIIAGRSGQTSGVGAAARADTTTSYEAHEAHEARAVRPVQPWCTPEGWGADASSLDQPAVRPGRPVRRVATHPAGRARGRVPRCATAAAPSLRGGRLTRRGRVVVALAWLVLIGLAALPIMRYDGAAAPTAEDTVSVEVRPGDTLWRLAGQFDAGGDPREFVDAVVSLNGLVDGGDIQPGDVVRVPVSGH